MATTAKGTEKKLEKEKMGVDALTAKLSSLAQSFKTLKNLNFELEGENQLRATLETERLYLTSCIDSDNTRKYYTALFSNATVMEKNGYGLPYTPSDILEDVQDYSNRWNSNNPFSALSIYERDKGEDETQHFVGSVILKESTLSTKPGTAILSYYISPEYWNTGFRKKEEDLKTTQEWKGIGSEAVSAVVEDYAPELKKRGYKLKQTQCTPADQTFEAIDATVRKDNIGSWKILENKTKMTYTGEKFMFGNGLRKCYTMKLK